ncbi:MAG TPA: ABC transporter ATP-binding protein [Beijerinckiaceae bacterium]|nr:ABC transporter ATP-binding protein [Beijerinckiaceae bacterium]
MTLLTAEGLCKAFGGVTAARDVGFAVGRGEKVALIGPNGAGKSTVFNMVGGQLRPDRGSVRLNGEDITGLAPYEIYRRKLARSFQITNIFPRLSVYENVRCAVMWSRGQGYAFWRFIDGVRDVRERTEAVLERIGLERRRDVQAGLLTYAEQRALEIGLAMAGEADMIMLDEPTAGMSHSETEHAVDLIRRITQGRTLLIVEHDMAVVFGLADRISVLVYGKVIASDTPERIKANKAVQEAYLGTVPE